MNEAILRINNVPIYGFGVLSVFSFLWGSFVYYKKASQSHFDDRVVLDSVVLSAFWGFILGRIAYAVLNFHIFVDHWSRLFLLTNYPGLDRFGVIAGIALGLWLCIRKIKAKFIDWFDLAAPGLAAGISIFFAGLSVLAFMWQFVLMAFLFLTVFIYFWNVEEKYRTFSWYRNNKTSARSGYISGLFLCFLGLLFLIEKIIMNNLIWQNWLWSGLLFVGGIILVYIRSGRVLSEDIKIFYKHG